MDVPGIGRIFGDEPELTGLAALPPPTPEHLPVGRDHDHALTPVRDVDVPVRADREATRVVQPELLRREHGSHGEGLGKCARRSEPGGRRN